MIKGEDIAALIKDPFLSTIKDSKAIEALIIKYPYCSSLYHLALKGEANAGSIEFEDKLKVAAAHVNDREHLYHLIHSKSTQLQPEGSDIVNEEDITASLKQGGIKVGSIEPYDQKEQNETKASNPQDVELHNPDQVKDEPLKDIETKKETTTSENLELDTEILSHAVSIAFEYSADTTIPEKDSSEKAPLKENNKEIQPLETENSLTKENFDTPAVKEEHQPAQENLTDATNALDGTQNKEAKDLSFIEWLQVKQLSTKKINSETAEVTEQAKIPAFKLEIKETSKSEINELLDKFIAEEPSISKPTKEFYSPIANAKKSLEESSEIVSETLAKIHIMQGNFSKAIAAYKQLSLLYPEKNSFFATQIEKIKQKQSQ